jgi:hypothetical protein
MYRKIIAVCSLIRTEHINTLCEQNVEFVNVKPGGKYSDHWGLEGYISVIKTSQLMLYRKVIAVCAQIHTEHMSKLCGQNVEFVNAKHSKHWVLQCLNRVLTPAT